MTAWKRIRLTARATLGLTLPLLLTLGTGTPSVAAESPQPPLSIPPGTFLVDHAGVLQDAAKVEDTLKKLREQTRYSLYVVYQQSFNGQEPTAVAQRILQAKQAGKYELLLAVATQDRKDALVTRTNSPLSQKQRDAIKAAAQAQLVDNKWDQAALDAAAALTDAAKGGSGEVNRKTNASPFLLPVTLIALVGVLGIWFWRRRRRRGSDGGTQWSETAPAATPTKTIEELKKEASSALIAVDDAIKSSEQEIAFAQAAYGDKEVEPFAKAISAAKNHLRQSFALQQKLDDDIPDTPEEQRDWYSQIIHHCEQANRELDSQKSSFTALRELEKNAPQALERIANESARATAVLEKTAENLHQMSQQYPAAALSPIKDNVEQARARLEFTAAATAKARQSLDAGNTSAAAVTVHAAEEALQQAILLEEAVARRNDELRKAEQLLPAALSGAESDLVQAQALAAHAPETTRAQVAAAAAAIQHARAQVDNGTYDPASTLSRVEAAHRDIDKVLASMRNQQEQGQRASAALQPALMAAQAQISAAADYIAARRGGIGSQARTRLAEAQRNLDYALSIQRTDPASALAYANQANTLAEQAQQLAYTDVSNFGYEDARLGFGGRGHHGSGFASSLGGALLGGIVGNLLSGNRWGGGGFGGWSSPDSGGFDWGGDGGFGADGGFSGDSGNF